MNYINICYIIIVLLFLPSKMQGEINERIYFGNIDIPSNQRSRVINCFVEDDRGFLYIGSNTLLRYDGFVTKNLNPLSEQGRPLRFGIIHTLVLDNKGLVWMGTETGVYIYNPKNNIAKNLKGLNLRGFPCRSIFFAGKEVVIGTDRGLHVYNLDTEKSKSYFSKASQTTPALSHNLIRDVYKDSKGRLWVATLDKLNIIDRDGKSNKIIDLRKKDFVSNNLVLSIEPSLDNDSILWIGTETGLCKLNTYTHEFEIYTKTDKTNSLSNNVIKTICVVDSKTILLGTDNGLNLFNIETGRFDNYYHSIENKYSINHNVVKSIYKDKQGLLWFATDNGVNNCDLSQGGVIHNKTSYSNPQIQNIDNVYAFAEDKDGNLWLGSTDGLTFVDIKTNKVDQLFPSKISHNKVRHLLVDRQNRLWVGTPRGINIIYPHSGKVLKYASDENTPLSLHTNYISCLTQDSYGNIWIGTYDSGIYQAKEIREGEFRFDNITKTSDRGFNISSNTIADIEADEQGNVWIASGKGVDRMHPITGKVEHISNKELCSADALSIDNGRLWAISENRIYKYEIDNEKLSLEKTLDYSIQSVIAHNDNLWIATASDIYCYAVDKNKIHKLELPKNGIDYFITRASYTNGKTAYFGGYSGYIAFDFDKATFESTRSDVFFTDLYVWGKEVKVDREYDDKVILQTNINYVDTVRLQAHQNNISIEFSTLDFKHASNNRFYYILEGYDDQWRETNFGGNSIQYAQLDYGRYTLRIKPFDEMGEILSSERTLTIEIAPPIWLTPIALLCYFLVVLLVVCFLFKMYEARSREKNELRIQRMQRDKVEELYEIKSKFFTNISHELKTPLTLIINPVKRLIDRENDPKRKESLRMIERNADRVLKLVNQVLDMRRMERGKERLVIQKSNIVEFCKLILDRLFEEAKYRNITLNFRYDLPIINIWIDAEKVEKIILNLLSNAFKFTPDGGSITMSISIEGVENSEGEADQYVRIQVVDTGCGVSQENIPYLFDRFGMVQSKNYTSQEGSGIGLSIVSDYVKMHSGDISVESKLGYGSSFAFTLPMSKDHLSDYEELLLDEGNEAIKSEEADKPVLLLVEDDKDMTLFVKEIFSDDFYVLTANDGQAGLEIILRKSPDIVVSDVMMPNMTGIELCRRVKKDIRTSHIPIVLLTAKNRQNDIIEGVEAGADDYISKPFNIEHLLLRTRKIIEQRNILRRKLLIDLETKPKESKEASMDEKFLLTLVDTINEKMADPEFSVQSLCDILQMNNNTLYNKVKALTGISVIDLIKQQRLNKAAQLLENHSYNISEVMYMVGFTHNSYFSRAFKNKFNLTPREYQKGKKGQGE